jgi:hypothetical protein
VFASAQQRGWIQFGYFRPKRLQIESFCIVRVFERSN